MKLPKREKVTLVLYVIESGIHMFLTYDYVFKNNIITKIHSEAKKKI